MIQPAVYTAPEVAAILGRHVKTVYEDARRGAIPCRRIGGRLYFPRARFDSWLQLENEPAQAVESTPR